MKEDVKEEYLPFLSREVRREFFGRFGRATPRHGATGLTVGLPVTMASVPAAVGVRYTRLGCKPASQGVEPHFFGSQACRRRSKTMGISNPEIQKKLFGPRWEHEIQKQGWPFWKRLMHRLQNCPICGPKSQTRLR